VYQLKYFQWHIIGTTFLTRSVLEIRMCSARYKGIRIIPSFFFLVSSPCILKIIRMTTRPRVVRRAYLLFNSVVLSSPTLVRYRFIQRAIRAIETRHVCICTRETRGREPAYVRSNGKTLCIRFSITAVIFNRAFRRNLCARSRDRLTYRARFQIFFSRDAPL